MSRKPNPPHDGPTERFARSLGSAVAFVGRAFRRPGRAPIDVAARVKPKKKPIAVPASVDKPRRRLDAELTRLEEELERTYAMITSTGRSNTPGADLQGLIARSRELRAKIGDVRDDLARAERNAARQRRLGEAIDTTSPTRTPTRELRKTFRRPRTDHDAARRRQAVAAAIERASFTGQSQRLSVEQLAAGLSDDDPEIRRQTVVRIGQTRSSPGLELLLVAADDASDKVRLTALNHLVGYEDGRVLKLFRHAWRDADPLARLAAMRGLTTVEADVSTAALIEALDDSEAAVRRTAAAALAWHGGEATVDALVLALADGEGAVRAAAAESLGVVGEFKAVLPLSRTLADSDEKVRDVGRAALRALVGADVDAAIGSEGGAKAVAAVREWWARARVEKVLARLGLEPLTEAEREAAAAEFAAMPETELPLTEAPAPDEGVADITEELFEEVIEDEPAAAEPAAEAKPEELFEEAPEEKKEEEPALEEGIELGEDGEGEAGGEGEGEAAGEGEDFEDIF